MIEGPDLTRFVKIAERTSAKLRRRKKYASTTDKHLSQVGLDQRKRKIMGLQYRILGNSIARGVFMAIGPMYEILRTVMLFEMGFR